MDFSQSSNVVPKMDATTDTGPSIKERRLGARAEGGL